MTLTRWSTRAAPDPDFERAWRARLAASGHAHFGFDPELLAAEAAAGRHALAVLAEEDGRRAALVLREAGAELVSGWPWRWQVVLEGSTDATPCGMSAEEAEWVWDVAHRVADGRRVRCYLPLRPAKGTPWFVAGVTFLQSLERDEQSLWMGLDGAKRRMVKRARQRGVGVIEAADPGAMAAFQALPRERDGGPVPPSANGAAPAPGEGYREWERPWMWLLLAVRDGVVEAGSGFGRCPGSSLDYRTNASTRAARLDGANVLLAWEAMRLGRARGFRWLNWGGSTRFKREFGGERVEIACRLGGGAVWAVPNLVHASTRRARAGVAGWRRRRASGSAGAPGGDVRAAWSTRQPLDPAFERRWREALGRAPLANFAFDAAYLAWEAKHGRHAQAALVEREGRTGLLVLREERGAWTCGWPWRWLATVADPAGRDHPALDPADARWLFRCAERLARPHRLRFYVPVPPPSGGAGFEAGTTIVQGIQRGDDEILAGMHASKRRMVRRARNEGYEVIEASTLDHFRTFAAIQRETFERHGLTPEAAPEATPPPGEAWREWELPWMWLLLAQRDGVIESGLGDGVSVGGMLEGRTGASTVAARRSGAFALLCLEEVRRGRERGYRWLNHGGDTPFKREMAGTLGVRLVMHCWMGGGPLWLPANRSEAWARRVRRRLPGMLRALRRGGEGR